ncbi:STAS domain-containing protein [Streptomyces sp. NPDC057403]|uniref:STAS domain-containing protein n=1 Tax=Streptomyces sp. NPDC057403 TaxID=3346119 RepID=UPI00369949BA
MTATADGVRVLRLTGEIDHGTGVILRDGLESADGARPRTVLCLSRLSFTDGYRADHDRGRSPGINILIAAHRSHLRAGGRLRLAGPSGSVRRTLRIAGVDDIFDCRETLHQALSI